METVHGMVEHVVFRNDENAYTVFSIKNGEEELTCVGCIPEISVGEYLRVEGDFSLHPLYGRQMNVKAISVEIPEDEFSIERYLGSGLIKGIGPALSARIVSRFGRDTFRIIEQEPERLAEIKGITAKKAGDIYEQFHARQDMRHAIIYLTGLGIALNLAIKIYKQYGEGLYSIIKENPYRLAEDLNGIGFKQADEIARNAGLESNSQFRIRSGIVYVMQQAVYSGHTCLPASEVLSAGAELLGVSPGMVRDQIQSLQIDRKIVLREDDGVDMIYLAIYYYMEIETAQMLMDLDREYRVNEKAVRRKLENTDAGGFRLDESQIDAVVQAAGNGVLLISGGPGTGKTTTINAMIDYFEGEGMEVLLAAPTGRAAKRMSEATGHEARTIHRMLEVSGDPDAVDKGTHFDRNRDRPLEADVIVIDEMSMVDIFLMNALLKAVPPGSRLILVGDVDQLPSVGPGHVLGNIIDSGCFHVLRLGKIYRQALESDIVKNAHLINEGRDIALDNKSRDFFCIRREDVRSILEVTIALVRDKLPPYVDATSFDIQVLTPMRKGELGVEKLNPVLQRYLNPPSDKKTEKELHGILFREGDKVMQIKNNYQMEWEIKGAFGMAIRKGTGVFNGDIGRIIQINTFSQQAEVEFDEGRRVLYAFSQMEELEHAYALTVHKSQGCEYPAVILPLLTGPMMLMNRNILYTAVTRARKTVAIVGSERTVRQMILSENQQKRYSALDRRILEAAEKRMTDEFV